MPLKNITMTFSEVGGGEFVEMHDAITKTFAGTNVKIAPMVDGLNPDNVDRSIIITNPNELSNYERLQAMSAINNIMSCE